MDDAVGVHRVLLLLSDVAEDDEDYDGAVDYVRQALEVAMASGNVNGAGKSLAAFEWLDQEEGFGPAAEAMLERSIDWFAQQKSIPNAADAAMLLGEIHRKRGQLETADHFYEWSRKVSQDNDHHTGTARAFGALGLLRMGDKDYDHADWYFKTASKLYEDAGEQGRERAGARTLRLEFLPQREPRRGAQPVPPSPRELREPRPDESGSAARAKTWPRPGFPERRPGRLTCVSDRSVVSVMTEPAEQHVTLPRPVQDFVLQWGYLGDRWGVNRSVSQVHALLYASERPLSSEEIASALGIARSNVVELAARAAGVGNHPFDSGPRRPPHLLRGGDGSLDARVADRRGSQGT